MHIHKLIAINAHSNRVVYEIDNKIISVRNQLVYYVNILSDNRLIAVGRDNRFELEFFDSSVLELLIKAGFIQISDTLLVNSNHIHQILIPVQRIELNNLLQLPYTDTYQPNIDRFLDSILIQNLHQHGSS